MHTPCAFDPNTAALPDSGIFGLPYRPDEAALVLLPVGWEATASYGLGTAFAPQAILEASKQIDLFDVTLSAFCKKGIALLPESEQVMAWHKQAKKWVQATRNPSIHADIDIQIKRDKVHQYSAKRDQWIYKTVQALIKAGKHTALLGGDHSTAFGNIRAFSEHYPDMGILHIDAHADLREAYEGFSDSHACIMHHVLQKIAPQTLVQVGIRDLCQVEFDCIKKNRTTITPFFDADIYSDKMQGKTWHAICQEIIAPLPQQVYISLDIDGLDPRFCPNTGTPVPGGLDFQEVCYLFKMLLDSGRTIISFDLTEVSPGPNYAAGATTSHPQAMWDAIIGARLLYQLCGYLLRSHDRGTLPVK